VISPIDARLADGKIQVTFTATDAATPIAHAEYSVDAGPWQYVEPVGKVSDSLTEHYDFSTQIKPQSGASRTAADPTEHLVTVRVYDRYENVGAAKAVVR
jgi:hypothetical protein